MRIPSPSTILAIDLSPTTSPLVKVVTLNARLILAGRDCCDFADFDWIITAPNDMEIGA
jgi:hypothetical protein